MTPPPEKSKCPKCVGIRTCDHSPFLRNNPINPRSECCGVWCPGLKCPCHTPTNPNESQGWRESLRARFSSDEVPGTYNVHWGVLEKEFEKVLEKELSRQDEAWRERVRGLIEELKSMERKDKCVCGIAPECFGQCVGGFNSALLNVKSRIEAILKQEGV